MVAPKRREPIQTVPSELMTREIFINPIRGVFMKLVREHERYVRPIRGSEWQVRGLFWEDSWYIWPGYFWTHETASAELDIPFSVNLSKISEGRAAKQSEFWYINEEDDAMGEHVVVHDQVGPTPRPIPFLRGFYHR